MENKIDLHKLNVMNYHISNNESEYYLCEGIRSLYRLSRLEGLKFKELLKRMNSEEQVFFNGTNGFTVVTMI